MVKRATKPYRAVSLFSNCGAGDVGYARAGFSFEVMAELEQRRLDVALLNHPHAKGVPGDLRKTWREVVSAYRRRSGAVRPALLAACPPCQGMSTARGGRGREHDPDAGSRDCRNLLVAVIGAVALELRPRLVVVENVEAFLTRRVRDPGTGNPVSAAALLARLLNDEYEMVPMVADLSTFGVPQKRKRAFLTFVHRTEPGLAWLKEAMAAPYPRQSHGGPGLPAVVTVDAALRRAGLRSLDARAPDVAADPIDPLHFVPVWTDRRYTITCAIPPGSGRSAWENDMCGECGAKSTSRAACLCASCGAVLPRPVTFDESGVPRLVRGFHTSYRRMPANQPAPTVTTASGHIGSDFTIHPTEHRLLSPRECAVLQTFPDDFEWGDALERWGATNVRAMIGEAVPPRFTELHGSALVRVLSCSDRGRTSLLAASSDLIGRAHRRLRREPTRSKGSPYPPSPRL